jgi:RHS repeat-associated protein
MHRQFKLKQLWCEVTNSSGAIQEQRGYNPFGQTTLLQGSAISDFGYAGYYVHQRSGLNLTKYRSYSPTLGRWLSRDPIGESGGMNLYAYVENDPTTYLDALGLDKQPGGGWSPNYLKLQICKAIAQAAYALALGQIIANPNLSDNEKVSQEDCALAKLLNELKRCEALFGAGGSEPDEPQPPKPSVPPDTPPPPPPPPWLPL